MDAYALLSYNRLADIYIIYGAIAFIHRYITDSPYSYQPSVYNLLFFDAHSISLWISALFTSGHEVYSLKYQQAC